ncbi:MAG: bifunctional phosphopantothenoylcysteine decarboxylase/phosphopantothenate--cysteine ligase CoaBC [Coprobacillaceae bacterium]
MKKNIIVGVTGSIAAYKAASLVSSLVKLDYDVEVIMSESATKFISPLTFESLIKKPVISDIFNEGKRGSIQHIELAKKADCFVIAPASANSIAKIANGIADDMLSTTFLAATCKKLIAPAMNTKMYDNLATQRNIERCLSYGISFVEPSAGLLACGDVGRGKLADPEDVLEMIEYCLEPKPLHRKKVLVTAGPTQEAMDPVRYITNHSSGKMGYALAKKAYQLGAEVTLISGPTTLMVPYGVKHIAITSANEMFEEVKKIYEKQDYIIKAAAVSDYRFSEINEQKFKKTTDEISVTLNKNEDILAFLGAHKSKQILCGFAMETENLEKYASEKFKNKNCDLLVANNLTTAGAGFKTDTNQVTFISENGLEEKELMSKDELSKEILLTLMKIRGDK